MRTSGNLRAHFNHGEDTSTMPLARLALGTPPHEDTQPLFFFFSGRGKRASRNGAFLSSIWRYTVMLRGAATALPCLDYPGCDYALWSRHGTPAVPAITPPTSLYSSLLQSGPSPKQDSPISSSPSGRAAAACKQSPMAAVYQSPIVHGGRGQRRLHAIIISSTIIIFCSRSHHPRGASLIFT
mmetsp:Transcript_30302/g.59183  ORF Transcript_30302/g.59183 Transcript_30302/m.59183 type:complete len:183 (-) Transcript_30302:447-995(-)